MIAGCLSVALLLATAWDDALALYKQRKYVDAARAFERALAGKELTDQQVSEPVLLLGQSYFLAGQTAKALPWLERAALLGTGGVELQYMLGTAYVLSHDAQKAVSAFARLFGVKPDSAAAELLTAQMFVRHELLELGEARARRALELDARTPEAHYLLGIIAVARGDVDRGIAEFRAETSLNPNFALAYYKLGDAYARSEQWDEAIPNLQRSIWLNPNNSGPYIVLGKVYFNREDLVNAEGVLRRALQMDPQNYPAHYLLGQVLVRTGRREEGRALLDKAQQLRPPVAP